MFIVYFSIATLHFGNITALIKPTFDSISTIHHKTILFPYKHSRCR